jgi:outer membrane protein
MGLGRWVRLQQWQIFIVTLLSGLLLGPQLVAAAGMMDILQLAQKNDPALQAAQFKKQGIGEHRTQAIARMLPILAGSAEYAYTNQDIRSSDNTVFAVGKTDYGSTNYGLTLTQPVFRWDTIVGYQQADAEILRAEAEYQMASQDLIIRVADLYMKALAARDQLTFAKAEQSAVDKHFELASNQFKKGLIPITDMHDAKARKATVSARTIEAENLLDDALQALQEVTGQPVTELDPLRADIALANPDPADADTWVKAAVKQNPAIALHKQAVEIAGKEVDRQNAAHYPTLDLVGSYNSEDTDGTLYGGGSQIDNTKVMLKLNVPLYQGGMVSSKAAEAEHQRSAARQELIRQTRAVERQTRSAFLGVKTALNRVEALHQSVTSNQSALEAKQEGFLSGLYTSLAVLDAERDLYLTKQEYAKARYEYLLNGLKLRKATDTLSGKDIQQMAQLFR